MEDRIITYGGQAVIEGVMMRGQKAFAIAMRAPDGKIVLYKEKLDAIYQSRITKIPFVRGVILLWDALGLGMRALTIAANTQTGEDVKLEGPALYLTLGFALVFGIGLFFLLPRGLGGLAEKYLALNVWWSNVIEEIVRLVLLIGYLWAISFMPDVKRLFMYHGAEHKTINAFEAGAEFDSGFSCKIFAGTSALRHGFYIDSRLAFHRCICVAWPTADLLAFSDKDIIHSYFGWDRNRIHSLDGKSFE